MMDKVGSLTPESQRKKLKELYPNRWVQRHESILTMSQLLHPAAEALEEISLWDDKDSSTGANLLLHSILQSEFLVALVSAEYLLSFTLILSKTLQAIDIDLASAVGQAENVISLIDNVRSNAEEEFEKLFHIMNSKAALLNTEITLPRLAKKQTQRNNVAAESIEEYYRRSIFLPWIDAFASHIRD